MVDVDYLAVNKALWEGWVPVHLDSDFYDLKSFLAGEECLRDFELAEVGDVAGRDLVHLQCHFGMDTLAWARHGANVTGLDFSERAIEAAAGIAGKLGLRARFVAADVYQAVRALEATYDIVYTGIGALTWLPDMERWAETVASLLRPGGFLYLAEFHPFGNTLDYGDGRTVSYDYFAEEPEIFEDNGSYADPDAETEHRRSVQFTHGLGTIVTALVNAGLRIDFLHEHEGTLFRRFGTLERDGRMYRFPAGYPRIPLMYSLRATKA